MIVHVPALTRCLKAFKTENFGEKAGTDRSSWPPRSLQSHREKHKEAKTHAEQITIEREHGCRYSVILELPMSLVIDPMHNLLVGTAKRFLSVWISEGLLETSHMEHMESIQAKVDSFIK